MKKAMLISGFLSGALAAAPLFASASWGQADLPAVEVRQVLRPERYQRGDTNVSRLQEIVAAFWDASRGMLADNLAKNRYSQHAQALAVIAGILSPEQEDSAFKAMIENRGVAKATNSFRHFLYAAYAKKGRTDLFLESLASMRTMVVKYGLKTPLEDDNPEARSDCHAWGANPLLHLHTDVAGVMPAEPGFKSVRIAPQPGSLKWIDCATPHPKGLIHVKLYLDGDAVKGEVTLPDGIGGVFGWKGRRQPLKPGRNVL